MTFGFDGALSVTSSSFKIDTRLSWDKVVGVRKASFGNDKAMKSRIDPSSVAHQMFYYAGSL